MFFNSFIVKVPKKHPGEFFEGLNLLSELLRPRGDSNVGQTQKIEVIEKEDAEAEDADNDDDIGDDDEQWYYKQELQEDKPDDVTINLDGSLAQEGGMTV